MKQWIIPVSWEVCGTVTIEADTLESAMNEARYGDVPLPEDSEYVDGSFDVTIEDAETVRECYNKNQQDEDQEGE